MSDVASGKAWERAVREHRAALSAFLTTVEKVDDDRWGRPVGEGKWTPAQIAEHLALAYEALLAELAGSGPMRAKAGPMMQRALRWVLLPHILFHRSFPVRAASPREMRPSEEGLPRAEAAVLLSELVERFEREISTTDHKVLTHPYFGPVGLTRALRFVAVHMEHHRRQIKGSARAPA